MTVTLYPHTNRWVTEDEWELRVRTYINPDTGQWYIHIVSECVPNNDGSPGAWQEVNEYCQLARVRDLDFAPITVCFESFNMANCMLPLELEGFFSRLMPMDLSPIRARPSPQMQERYEEINGAFISPDVTNWQEGF